MTDINDPKPIDMVTQLHEAVFGDSWARPETPQTVWEMLLDRVRGLAAGWCGECIRRDDGGLAGRLAAARAALWSIRNECEPYTFGKDGYDITLDHIHDIADALLTSVTSTPATPPRDRLRHSEGQA